MGVPHMVSDVGGMSELVDLERFSEAVVPHGSEGALAVALQAVLERGTLPVLPLRQTVLPPCALAPLESSAVSGSCQNQVFQKCQLDALSSVCMFQGFLGMC